MQQEAIYKDLGVNFNNDLTINYVSPKAHKLCYMALHSFSSCESLFLGLVFQLYIRPSLMC